MRVDYSIVSVFLFRIDVLLFSESVLEAIYTY